MPENDEASREEEIKRIPLRAPNPSTWPPGVRGIAIGEADAFGVDAEGTLYWHGKPVEIRRPLELSKFQSWIAIIVSAFAIIGSIGAVAQGWAAYNDWACKTKWWPMIGCESSKPDASAG